MLKKSGKYQKILHIFIFFAVVAAILFSLFGYLSLRTNLNIITEAVEAIRNLAAGESISVILSQILTSVSSIYGIVIVEIVVLLGAFLASLFAIMYLIDLYFMSVKTSMIDELTNVYNKRALNTILDKEIKRAERFKHPLSILMMDIDFFKVYNDKNGHVAGDLLLKRISRIMFRSIRDVDTIGRYGGEEFLVILPETSHAGAARIAERIRKNVLSTRFEGERNQPGGKVTVSLGLTTFHGEYGEKSRLVHSADELLYKAKESGRNQLIKAYYKKGNVDGKSKKKVKKKGKKKK